MNGNLATAAGSPSADDCDLARALVLEHGWNTTCYQVLNTGIDLWFSEARDAVIGYVTRNRVRVVAGAPICSQDRIEDVLEEWHGAADHAGHKVCYFGAEQRIGNLLRNRAGYSTVVLGAQPVWDPESFLCSPIDDAELRYQLNRAANKRVAVREWPTQEAQGNRALQVCLSEWLATRGLPTMHFLVEPHTLDRLMDRRLFVAERDGSPVGFVVLTPVPSRQGWLTEQFVRGAKAPNGTIELTLMEAIRTVCGVGASFVTMGIVPLSQHGIKLGEGNPAWLRLLVKWIRAHGRRFYNFDGLDRFKSKFHPDEWEPIYAISREADFSFRTLYAIAAAFSEGPPWLAGLRGLGRAIRQEIVWMGQRLGRSRA